MLVLPFSPTGNWPTGDRPTGDKLGMHPQQDHLELQILLNATLDAQLKGISSKPPVKPPVRQDFSIIWSILLK